MLRVAFTVCSMVSMAAATSINYCGSRMCGNTNAHTFCQFHEGPSPRCVGNIKAPLSMEEKARVMARLNRRRNDAAEGRLRGLPRAGNMLKLRWVEELAREAQRWADQCRPPRTPEEHDVCRDLYSIPVGQCVASVVGEAPGLRVESMIDMWYMQSILYKGNVTFYTPPQQNSSFYGDFGQIMWSRSYMVGCGRSRFMSQWHGRLRTVERLVCNLAPHGPVPSRPLWVPAAPTTNCPPRAIPDRGFNALCNFHQNVTDMGFIETSTTLEENILLNTVLEIENNQSLNYLGSLDEIYLTQLAIATVGNTVSTQAYYSSMQRRDLYEMKELQEADGNTVIKVDEGEEPNMTIKLGNTPESTKTPKKKISLVGRPKSYNIEDLTVFDKDENHDPPIEDLTKREKEFYSEYEFFEAEENATVNVEVLNTTTPTEKSLNDNMTIIPKSSLLNENLNATLNILIDAINPNKSTWDVTAYNEAMNFTVMENVGHGLPPIEKNVDDYFSDPETVRQLQDALDRMEHTLEAQQITERQGKVRREIRRLPQEISTEPIISEELAREIERNKTIARGPMMNMVLKYMPYLKEYQGGLVGRSTDGSGSVTSSIVIVLLCVVIV